jgi:hypothetical protein
VGTADADTRRLARVIDHPIRSRILQLLGERGPLGWKELSAEVGVRTGALYHHLDTLEGLVERDESKKYSLTKSGRIVYERTSQSHTIDAVRQAATEIKHEGASRRILQAFFTPRSAIESISSRTDVSAVVLIAVAVGLALFSGVEGISPALYYLRPDPGPLQTVGAFSASLGGVVLFCYLVGRLAFNSVVDVLTLAAATVISFLPVFALSALTRFPLLASAFASSPVSFTLLLVFFQAWSTTILGAGLSVSTGVRIERTLLVSLVLLYATMFVMLVLGTKL